MNATARMKDDYLYRHMPKIEDFMIRTLENNDGCDHVFTEKFNRNMEALLSANDTDGKRRRMSAGCRYFPRVAVVVLVLVVAVGGIGLTANAASNGRLFGAIRAFCFGGTSGATSTFYYGTTDSSDALSIEDFPDGTVEAEIVYQGDGCYTLTDGTEIPIERIVFLNPEENPDVGDVLAAFILPE